MARELSDWLATCAADDIEIDGVKITCWFGARDESRKHVVRVTESGDCFRLEATVLGQAGFRVFEDMGQVASLYAWRLNRTSRLVGIRVDSRDRFVAEAAVPKAGLTTDEMRRYLRVVAAGADRLELVLTGRDVQ